MARWITFTVPFMTFKTLSLLAAAALISLSGCGGVTGGGIDRAGDAAGDSSRHPASDATSHSSRHPASDAAR